MSPSERTAKHIIIITVDGFFGQAIPTEKSLDTESLKTELRSSGYEVSLMNLEDLANLDEENTEGNAIYLIGSHQNPEIKNYINDVVSIKSGSKLNFLPRPELILAHENKGVQCLLGKRYKLQLPQQDYLYNAKEPESRTVIKHVSGAGSKMVFIAEDNNNYSARLFLSGLTLLTIRDVLYYIKSFVKTKIRWKHFSTDYINFNKRYFRHVRQKFIKSPGYDFKVLVFFDRVYVLRREERTGDFRASGSGKFTFERPSNELVRFALDLRRQIDTPYVSLDLILGDEKYECIEFQCVHFGPYTQQFAPHYYTIENNELVEHANSFSTEASYSYAIATYISSQLKISATG
jgi:glutathione synthase/RimK-type ligase-like ATP-grasp enzyme